MLSLAGRLAVLPDPRKRRGMRYPYVSLLLVACAVTADARLWAAIGQWARSAPQETHARLDARMIGQPLPCVLSRCPPSVGWSVRVCPGGLADLARRGPAGGGHVVPAAARRRPHRYDRERGHGRMQTQTTGC